MSHHLAQAVTAGPVTALHEGISVQLNSFTLNTTASGSVSIALAAIPAGSRIKDVWLKRGDFGRNVGSGGHVVCLNVMTGGTNVGNLFAQSVSFATFLRMSSAAATNPAIGTRLTASSQLWLVATTGSGTATTGTAATTFQVCLEYLRDGRGD